MKAFLRAQLSAVSATAVDYGVTVTLAELLHVYYLVAVALGALCGAITNFTINYRWAFRHQSKRFESSITRQSRRYVLVAVGSLIFNVCFVGLLTETLNIPYLTSKVVASVSVGFFYNYPLHKYYVFKIARQSSL